MNLEQQHAILDKTYKDLTKFCGKPPRGNVRIFGFPLGPLGPHLESRDISWECLLSKHISSFKLLPQIGDTDCKIVI